MSRRSSAIIPPPGRQVGGIVLAGGESRRMGRDKAFIPWGESFLLQHAIDTLRPLVDEVIVVVDDLRRFPPLGVRVVEDVVPGAHALGGLYTGLRAASHGRSFVCACDAPLLVPRLIQWLVTHAEDYELIIPLTADGLQPLHAVYAKSALPVIERQLQHRRWDLRALVPLVRARVVGPEVVQRYDPEELSFLNVNTPEEYATACKIHQRRSSEGGDDGHLASRRVLCA